MNIIKSILKFRGAKDRQIVLPEAQLSKTVLNAGLRAAKLGICKIILLGDEKLKKFESGSVCVINPESFPKRKEMEDLLFELRKEKGLTKTEAKKLLKDPNYFAVMLVKMGIADGMVSGKVFESAKVVRPALQIIKAKNRGEVVSSCFLMIGGKQNYCFADCALIPSPTAEELCQIACQSAQSTKLFLNEDAKVSMLSYATLGSAKGESPDKVSEALKLLKRKNRAFEFGGPYQADCAMDKAVARVKAPKEKIAGNCNTLVFPNLDAGNIAYKLFRFACGCLSVGPIMQNLARPINDLSRAATEKEILLMIAITAMQTN